MKQIEQLKKISDSYKENIDDLAESYELDTRKDYLYSDAVQAQRVAERNAKFNRLIDDAARKAVKDAAPLIGELRATLKTYITTSADPTTLATLQSLVSSGIELSSTEIAAFANGAGYAVLRLLEKPSKGHIRAPRVEALEADLKELDAHFQDIGAYRGEMTAFGPGGYFGQSSTVGNIVVKGKIDHFADKLTEIQERWAVLEGGDKK